MKRLNRTEWTDGKDIYVGNPKEGFTLKEKVRIVELEEPTQLKPAPQEVLVDITFDEDVVEPGCD